MVNCKVVVGMRPMVWGKDICDDRNGLYGKKIDLPIEPFIGLKIDGRRITNINYRGTTLFLYTEEYSACMEIEEYERIINRLKEDGYEKI